MRLAFKYRYTAHWKYLKRATMTDVHARLIVLNFVNCLYTAHCSIIARTALPFERLWNKTVMANVKLFFSKKSYKYQGDSVIRHCRITKENIVSMKIICQQIEILWPNSKCFGENLANVKFIWMLRLRYHKSLKICCTCLREYCVSV